DAEVSRDANGHCWVGACEVTEPVEEGPAAGRCSAKAQHRIARIGSGGRIHVEGSTAGGAERERVGGNKPRGDLFVSLHDDVDRKVGSCSVAAPSVENPTRARTSREGDHGVAGIRSARRVQGDRPAPFNLDCQSVGRYLTKLRMNSFV